MAKLERVGTDHPQVCQANTGNGPCVYKAEPNALCCSIHSGSATSLASERRELKNYRLNNVYADRARDHGTSPHVKNLTDEIGLLRVTLETVFNSISNANEMLLYVDKIEKLAKGINGLITSLQTIQEKNKELLGRDVVMSIIDQILEKICLHVSDPDVLRTLADECFEVVTKGIGQ